MEPERAVFNCKEHSVAEILNGYNTLGARMKSKFSRLAIEQNYMDFGDELIVDNFAGGGGASAGIEKAFGRSVDIAINHDPEAIAQHKINHPDTKHYCENVWDVDPREACGGRPVGLAWFSPDCKHFSRAKGATPVEKKIRGLAWVTTRWAAAVRPRVIMLENVKEFKTWGPLTKDNKPCKRRTGKTFRSWKKRLKNLGYKVEHREIKACDHGAPTIRDRFFLIARCDGKPIVWPEATHGQGLEPYRTAADCIDWTIRCPSIFGRKKLLAANTMRRIAKGTDRFVLNEPNPFIVRIGQTGFGGNRLSYPIDKPLTTITSKAEHLLVEPWVVKHFGGMVGVSAETPFPTITARGTQNQIIATNLIRQFGKSAAAAIDKPVGTIMPGGSGKTCLQESHLITLRNNQVGQSMDQPAPTITAGGLHLGQIQTFLVKYYGTAIGQSSKVPLHSVTTKARFGLVNAEMFEQPLTDDQRYSAWCVARMMEEYGDEEQAPRLKIPHPRPSAIGVGDYLIVDICMRMLSPRELYTAQGFDSDYIIEFDYKGKPLTKTAQVRMCGNSVSPVLSEALVSANFFAVDEKIAA